MDSGSRQGARHGSYVTLAASGRRVSSPRLRTSGSRSAVVVDRFVQRGGSTIIISISSVTRIAHSRGRFVLTASCRPTRACSGLRAVTCYTSLTLARGPQPLKRKAIGLLTDVALSFRR